MAGRAHCGGGIVCAESSDQPRGLGTQRKNPPPPSLETPQKRCSRKSLGRPPHVTHVTHVTLPSADVINARVPKA